MQILVVAVGRLKERFWEQAADEYLKRLGPYASVRIVEVPDRDTSRLGDERARELEGADVLKAIPGSAWTVALDIAGTQVSSEGLAARIGDLALIGRSSVAFVIGGSTGLSPAVLAHADERISFGPVTLPHNLARIVLLEQVYRAFRINRGEPYHK